ncbi:MAG: Lrp/AsnC family transcriptional regulator [Fibrobacter sp.]|uniref:Lrp/AsnC family transcriptional regulator n=1 Tax=Fibrobacter sp. TaxID=35828 RepID=UPI002A91923A|nr:Lrp/AsnC family transcriptional regulator [Fibrobacter sp.]MDY6264169.1 Lrp/AsnC family transcriptional regulator [Fibrobacter sp.]
MNELEQNILAIIQDAFPLEERPYLVLAEQLGSDEQSVFAAVENLRHSGIIRRIGGVYDSKKLGFISRLCAGKVPTISAGASDDFALNEFAATVNEIPAITHNYVRSHEYNVWFTVIAQSEAEIQKIVDDVCAKTELHDVHVLSATKKYKINTVMGAVAPTKTEDEKGVILSGAQCAKSKDLEKKALTDCDRIRIRVACTDIPHSLTPFKDWGVSCDELRDEITQKRMRRFGAILRHQEAGFAFNAMVCFRLDERRETKDERSVILSEQSESKDPAGAILAQKPYISHCYERPSFEGFPYTLYAMMHAQSADELDRNIKEAAKSIGNPDYVVLHSVRELKKTSYRFFA